MPAAPPCNSRALRSRAAPANPCGRPLRASRYDRFEDRHNFRPARSALPNGNNSFGPEFLGTDVPDDSDARYINQGVCTSCSLCGTPYANYQGASYDDVMARFGLIGFSTSDVSGATTRQAAFPSGPGGLIRAIVPRDGPGIARYDTFGYDDNNVPCGQKVRVHWSYGNVNPQGQSGTQPIFGWGITQKPTANTRC